MVYIKKKTKEYENWLIKRNKKNQRSRSRKNRKKNVRGMAYLPASSETDNTIIEQHTVIAPVEFSLISNTEAALKCFDKVFSLMAFSKKPKSKRKRKIISFDLSNVTALSIDAIM